MRTARDKKRVRDNAHSNCGGIVCGGGDFAACVLIQMALCGLVERPIAEASAESKAESLRSLEAAMAPVVGADMMQDALRDAIGAAAQSDGIKLKIAPPVAAIDKRGEPDYRELSAKGVDTVLEVTLRRVFLEPGADSNGKVNLDPVLPLNMQAHVRLLKTRDNSLVFFDDYAYHGKSYQYSEWAASGGDKLKGGLKKGYVSLGRDISDRIFKLYPFALRTGESGYCGLGALAPKDNMAESLTPVLAWQAFPLASDVAAAREDMKRAKDVKYELVVGSGENDETPDIFYHVDGLTAPTHELPVALKPDQRYFWSVRAYFELDGRKRVTEWATYCPFSSQLVVGANIFRFYTPQVGPTHKEPLVKGPKDAPFFPLSLFE